MKEFSSWVERLSHERDAFLAQCDLCGLCVDVCTVYQRLGINKNSAELQADILDVLSGQPATPEAYHKTWACSLCGKCLNACPKGLNPYLIQAVVKSQLVAHGQSPKAPAFRPQGVGPDIDDVLCSLQVHPSEVRWLRNVPDKPSHADVVFFLGCAVRRAPDKILASMDMLAKLGLDFVTVAGGGDLCCGLRPWATGKLEQASLALDHLVRTLAAFTPRKVLCWCGTCYYLLRDEAPRFADVPFEVQFLSQFLRDNLSRFDIKQPIGKTITIHDSCNLGRKAGDYTSVRELLGAIPGLRSVEMRHAKEDALCCGGGAWGNYQQIAQDLLRERLEEIEATGAAAVVSSCTGCHRYFTQHGAGYAFESQNYINLFAEALGLPYEDKLSRYIQYHDVDRVLADAREYIKNGPLSEPEIKAAVSGFFS